MASSPPLWALAGWGIMWEPWRNLQEGLAEVEKRKWRAREASLVDAEGFILVISKFIIAINFIQMSEEASNNYVTQADTSAYAKVLEAHRILNQEIAALNDKVEKVMDRHEGEFLLAYQNHIRRIKYELEEIKSKSDEQETELKKNDRVHYLEKQITLFREEALKLYDRLEEKTQEAEIYRLKAKDLEKTCFISQKEVRELTKMKKMFEAKAKAYDERIADLEARLAEKDDEIGRLTALGTASHTKAIKLSSSDYKLDEKATPIRGNTVNKNSIGFRKKTVSYVGLNKESELKEWFVECIKSIKKDVAYRKNSGYQFDLNTINNIDEFKMVDKLKLLEKFMENEKLLTWMYEKIFPSRIDEIKDYLSQRSLSLNPNPNPNPNPKQPQTPDNSHKSQQSQNTVLELIDAPLADSMLPKMSMSNSKQKRHQVRNRLSLKEGKLNLSAF